MKPLRKAQNDEATSVANSLDATSQASSATGDRWDRELKRFRTTNFQSVNVSKILERASHDQMAVIDKLAESSIKRHGELNLMKHLSGLNHYLHHYGSFAFDLTSIRNFRTNALSSPGSAIHYNGLISLLQKWHKHGYPGIPVETLSFIESVKKIRESGPTAARIKSGDPNEGWYSEDEYEALINKTWSEFESGKESLWATTAILLTAQFGRRPAQLALLKIGDVKEVGVSHGVSGRRVEFPGVKDKDSEVLRGSKFEVHPLSDDLWTLCQMLANESAQRFMDVLQLNLSEPDRAQLPLFLPLRKKELLERVALARKLNGDHSLIGSLYIHCPPKSIYRKVIRIHRDGPVSERTGERIHQYPYRYRYTRCRQLARANVPKAVLRYWMGHTSECAIDHYYDDPAERARELNEYIAPVLSPLAQAFHGTLRDTEADAIRGDDPTSRIELDGKENLGVGTCGEHGYCSASVPIPCYRCTKFQPWVDGPHDEVLQRLLERKQMEAAVPRPGMGRRLLVAPQLDADIKAVETVIKLCQLRKAQLGQKSL